MITITANGLPYIKPVLMYARAEGLGKRPRQLEIKVFWSLILVQVNANIII
jgi:hypothetical protein